MKLKKIASLMLAGIMAVSMLAGCKSGNGTDDKTPETENVTSGSQIIDMVNDAIAPNKAGIKFATNAELSTALKVAVEKLGVSETDANVQADVVKTLDVTNNTFSVAGLNGSPSDGAKRESVIVYKVSGKNETSLSAAYSIVSKIADVVNGLDDEVGSGADVLKFTYSNAYISMLETTVDGTNYYFVAVTLNSDMAKK